MILKETKLYVNKIEKDQRFSIDYLEQGFPTFLYSKAHSEIPVGWRAPPIFNQQTFFITSHIPINFFFLHS